MTIVEFINSWKDFIVKVFSEYPLAGALGTILAIIAYILLDRKWRRGKVTTNLLLVLVGWAILVPILGVIAIVIGEVWPIIRSTASKTIEALLSSYHIYERHPLMVLILVAAGIVSYFVWKRWWPEVVPSRKLRVLCLIVAVFLLLHIAAPIADLLTSRGEQNTKPPTKAAGNTQEEQVSTMHATNNSLGARNLQSDSLGTESNKPDTTSNTARVGAFPTVRDTTVRAK